MVSVTMTRLIHRENKRPKNFTRAVYKRELTPAQVEAIVKAIDTAMQSSVNGEATRG